MPLILYKGSLITKKASDIIADAIRQKLPIAHIVIKPMADGGEGTAEAMMMACGGRWIPANVMGPLPKMQVEAGFAWFDRTKTALVEMASANNGQYPRAKVLAFHVIWQRLVNECSAVFTL